MLNILPGVQWVTYILEVLKFKEFSDEKKCYRKVILVIVDTRENLVFFLISLSTLQPINAVINFLLDPF